MDRGAWWAKIHRVAKNWTQHKQLSIHICILFLTVILDCLRSEGEKKFPNPISLFIFKIYVNKPHQERVCPFLLLCAASGAMGPEAWQLGKPSPGMSPGPALWFLGAGDLPLDRGASGPMLTSTLPLQGPGWSQRAASRLQADVHLDMTFSLPGQPL